MYIPNELKLIIYNLCDDIYTKILLNKVFKWSFYEGNPLQNFLYKIEPIKINVKCGGFDNFTIICPFCYEYRRIFNSILVGIFIFIEKKMKI